MTELLIVAIQFLAETALPAALSVPFDWPAHKRRSVLTNFFSLCFIFALIGGSLGWFLSAFVPPLIEAPALRISNLILSPVLAGFIGYRIALWKRENSDPTIEPTFHFFYTFLFAFGFVCMRFAYAR